MEIKKRKHITRIENGWWVRFFGSSGTGKTRRQVHVAQKTFLDSNYKSSESAHRAAVRYRNKFLRAHPDWGNQPNVTRGFYKTYNRPSKRGNFIVGVALLTRRGRYRHVFVASWTETVKGERRQRTKGFSFDPIDDDARKTAYGRAVELRKKMCKLHYSGAY